MAAPYTMRTAPFGVATFNTSIVGSLVAVFARWNDARVTRSALGKLSDRELDDIGLSRGDIDAIVGAR